MNPEMFGFDITNPESRARSVNIFLSGIEGMIEEYKSGTRFNNNKHILLSNIDYGYNDHYWREFRVMLEELDVPLLNTLEEKFAELRNNVK